MPKRASGKISHIAISNKMKYKDIIELEKQIVKDNEAATDEDYKKVWNKLINAMWKHVNPNSLN